MKKPTLKEVQEHFKNAKKVKSLFTDNIFNLKKPFYSDWNWYDEDGQTILCFEYGYAEIIITKINKN